MPKKRERIEKKVTINGKRISVYGYTAFEISQKIEKLKTEAENAKRPFFNSVLEDWQEEHFKKIAVGTQTCYKPAIKRAKQEFENIRLCDITPADISELLKLLAAQGYSLQTVKVQKTVISKVFEYAIGQNLTRFNPAEHAPLPPKLPKKPREIPDDDVIDIIMKSTTLPFGTFPYLLLLTGCRRGEALALQWQDIDFNKKTITVNKTVTYNGNKPHIENHTKTNAGMRKVILLDALLNHLLPLAEAAEPDDYVFNNSADTKSPLTQTEFRRRWQKYITAAKIEITPHQLRHAYATILFDAKVDEKVAQSFMGHSKIEITRNIYTHIRQQRAQLAANDLNNFINNM